MQWIRRFHWSFVAGAIFGAVLMGLVGLEARSSSSTHEYQSLGMEIPQSTQLLRYHFQVQSSIPGQKVWGAWIAVDVGDVAPKGFMIDAAHLDLPPGEGISASFSLNQPDNGWPTGLYELRVLLSSEAENPERVLQSGQLIHTEVFQIQ